MFRSDFLLPLWEEAPVAAAAAVVVAADAEARILAVRPFRPWPAAEERLLSSVASRASGAAAAAAAALAGFTSWLSGIARGLGGVGELVGGPEAGWVALRSRVRFLCSSMLQRYGEKKRKKKGGREGEKRKTGKVKWLVRKGSKQNRSTGQGTRERIRIRKEWAGKKK